MLQAQDLLDVLNFRIVRDLRSASVPDIKKLAPQWEDTIFVPANDAEPADG